MFREGTNIKGFIFFVIILIAIFVYLAWQSGGVVTQENSLVLDPVNNYEVKLTYDNVTYTLWRYDNLLKFQQDEQIQFYYDLSTDTLKVYNQDRLVAPSSNFSDFLTKYDPYQVVSAMKQGLSYNNKENTSYYAAEMYGENVSVFLNDNDLPDTILFDNSDSKVQYMYLRVGDLSINDVLPQIVENEDQI
ncbi:MAG: hypothetical protein ACKKL6_02110 [Candidatus Komeilibacteria bacterium]